jgi:MFS family permease
MEMLSVWCVKKYLLIAILNLRTNIEMFNSCSGPLWSAAARDLTSSEPSEFCLFFSCLCSALYTPFVYAPAKSESLGESITRTSWIITALGATNTICRVLVGFIIDLPFVDCVLINTLALILAGILTCLVCVFNSWNLLMMYAALFGVCMGESRSDCRRF